MKHLRLLLIIFLCSCSGSVFFVRQKQSLEPGSSGEVIRHTYYALAYSEAEEQAYWVFYRLTADQVNGTQKRTDDYRPDPYITTGSAALADYKNSGYDRGHLCPAADMKQNKTAMSETYYLSNMSPQVPGFNRGIWNRLESQVRDWTLHYSDLWVVTGPVFGHNLDTIGANGVIVPGSYYKIIYSVENGMMGFLLPNEASSLSLDQFVVKVDEIEQQTGIDFFSGLADSTENRLESTIDLVNWVFK